MTPKEAYLRNMVLCTDCGKFYRATKYLPKEIIQDCKDADWYGTRIYPNILCGKCGTKYYTKYERSNGELLGIPKPHRLKRSKRRQKIILEHFFMRKHFYDDE